MGAKKACGAQGEGGGQRGSKRGLVCEARHIGGAVQDATQCALARHSEALHAHNKSLGRLCNILVTHRDWRARERQADSATGDDRWVGPHANQRWWRWRRPR